MIDMEKLSQEFAFLRDKVKEIASFVMKNELTEANFLLGCLHSICHNHAVSIGNLVPPKIVPVEDVKENPKVEPING